MSRSKQTVIYISGHHQHAGKTVTSLGILSRLRERYDPGDLGYIKPVGQELLEIDSGRLIDKDAEILDTFSGIPELDLTAVSPVRLASGFTKQFIDAEDKANIRGDLAKSIEASMARLSKKRIIVAEGTGHPGVGGIVGLANSEVAGQLGADVLYLAGGGIGRSLDILEVDLNYFSHKGINVRGVLFNKVIEAKMDTMTRYVTEDVLNRQFDFFPQPLSIFGYLPELPNLSHPSMSVIVGRFAGSYPIGDTDTAAWRRPCNRIKVVSLAEEYLKPEAFLDPGDIVIIGAGSQRRRHRIIRNSRSLATGGSLGGIILTCGATTPLHPNVEDEVRDSGIPCLYVQEDTALAEEKVLKAYQSSKIQTFDDEKVRLVRELFRKHFDFDKFIRAFSLE